MGFWKKVKKALGIARKVSPGLDEKLKQAEELHGKTEAVREIAEQVMDVADTVKGLGDQAEERRLW